MERSVRQQQAVQDQQNGFNCAQSVIRQFIDLTGLSAPVATKLASGLGCGVRTGHTCGAVSGSIITLGLLYGYESGDDEEGREFYMCVVQHFIKEFMGTHQTTLCKELLGMDVSIPDIRQTAKEQGLFQDKCPQFVMRAIEIVEDIIHRCDEANCDCKRPENR